MSLKLFVICAAIFVIVAGRPDCYKFEDMKDAKGNVFRGEHNVGKCTCKVARDQELAKHIADKWVPACDGKGFAPKQVDMVGAFCLDSNGNQKAAKIITRESWKVKC